MKGTASITNKIFTDLQVLKNKLDTWKKEGQKVVFTNGCFDILHKGHVSYLAEAAALGNKLVIGLNDDDSVKRQNKSINRPLQDESSRAFVLASLGFVDAVILFNEETPLELIKTLQPNILVKGADYNIENIVGAKEVLAAGGEVKTIDLISGYSTTAIEKKIKEQ